MMAHPFDDVQDLHLKPRITRHASEGTEKTMFFRTERIFIGCRFGNPHINLLVTQFL